MPSFIGIFRPRLSARGARRRLPLFSFEYGDTGAGADVGIERNWAAFDAIKVVPRYGIIHRAADRCRVVRHPLRGADRHRADGRPVAGLAGRRLMMAKAAQRARVPYTLGGRRRDHRGVAEVAPDVFWLQLYRFYQNDHAIGFDLIAARPRPASSAGAHHRRAGAHHAHARSDAGLAARSIPTCAMICR